MDSFDLLIDSFNLSIDSFDLLVDFYQSFNQKEIENDQLKSNIDPNCDHRLEIVVGMGFVL